jgi:hypothetical protein
MTTTVVVIKKETRDRLRYIGRKEQTYDDIISELIEKTKKDSDRLNRNIIEAE